MELEDFSEDDQHFFFALSKQLNDSVGTGKHAHNEKFDEMLSVNEYVLLRDITRILFEVQDMPEILKAINQSKSTNFDEMEQMAFVLKR